jgi:tRNA G18 (ribose-2'-O)-methylase SpoU
MGMMTPSFYQIRQCINPACGLRYPLVEAHPLGERCPLCLGETQVASQRPLNLEAAPSPPPPARIRLEALLDNVRSAWNVGAIFRTADGLGVEKLHLCGITPTPANPSVAKTALGAEKTIPWTTSKNALTAALALQAAGAQLWALEQDERAVPLAAPSAESGKIVLIVGNEVTGVDPALLDLCERIAFIPMRGQKRSLNVEVAFGVAVSWLVG